MSNLKAKFESNPICFSFRFVIFELQALKPSAVNTRSTWGPVGGAKAWCLLIYAEASLSLTGGRAKAWCLLIHADASVSLSLCHRDSCAEWC